MADVIAGPVAEPPLRAAGLNCPSCGASIQLHTEGWATTVACGTCGSVLDAQDPNLRVLQGFERALTVRSTIPLGSRGTWAGATWEVVGCQRVTITVEGIDYSWMEYVAFNPYRGFRYFSEYEGHWTSIEKLKRTPEGARFGGGTQVTLDGRRFVHFQTAQARTTFALGEFPWELRVGDEVTARDFVAPPFILSSETTDDETTWSLGTYVEPAAVWRAFGVEGKPPKPRGVFACQPNPHGRDAKRVGKLALAFLLAWLVLFVGVMAFADRDTVLTAAYTAVRSGGSPEAVVTEPFDLSGRTSNVRVTLETDVDNDWLWFAIALINADDGTSRDVDKTVSYYYGRDGGESWSEGSRRGRVTFGQVPAGRYFLRLAPEGGEVLKATTPVNYKVSVERDVPSVGLFIVAFILLLTPAGLAWLPALSFEQSRWSESDSGTVNLATLTTGKAA